MVKTEFEEDDSALPDTLDGLDLDEEMKEEPAKPIVKGMPKAKFQPKINPKEKTEVSKTGAEEPKEDEGQEGQNLGQIINQMIMEIQDLKLRVMTIESYLGRQVAAR